MNNLIRRVANRELGRDARVGLAWDPFQVMRDLLQADVFRDDASLGQGRWPSFMPSFDVRETADAFHFHADLPGLKREDLEITLNGNLLSISGRREAERRDEPKSQGNQREDTDRYHTAERWYGSFARSFSLPDGIDASGIAADLNDGVLKVTVPKRPEVQPRKIAIAVNGDGSSDKKATA